MFRSGAFSNRTLLRLTAILMIFLSAPAYVGYQELKYRTITSNLSAICRKNLKISVYNHAMWKKYKYELTRQKSNDHSVYLHQHEIGAESDIQFQYRFGETHSAMRPELPHGSIYRNDTYLFHGPDIVAKFSDFILIIDTFEGAVGFNCLDAYGVAITRGGK